MVYLGLYGGMVLGFLGWYFGRRAASKKRGLDEMYRFIWGKARSASWYFTMAAIYVLLILSISGVQISLIPALSILLLVHVGSWAIAGAYYSTKMSENGTKSPSVLLSLMIGIVVLMIFGIVSAITGNWKFLLFSLPPVFMTTMSTMFAGRKRENRV